MTRDDATRPTDEAREEDGPPVVCRKLRTKVAFGSPQPGMRDWRYGESTTAVYWCLKTMETAGPDDNYAHPHRCQSGRLCYLPPPEAEEPDRIA
ncbi:hypothetical protein [Polyangium aurulentum]|uniref:hypothetical protein n=1 Tax=Polyangium aurulentum TaxID=2567896 RepID=UPI0010AE8347|nr:hypothetical protein [Polyangium aurulentum]UQA58701.1 hypothetical protein E8A73_046970 [Polyangium aurulentum]